MSYLICTNEQCSEYLIRKTNPAGFTDVSCGVCGESIVDDDGRGIAPEDRPNPDNA
jgi:hypothetical protein